MKPSQHITFALVGAFLMFALDHEIFTSEKAKVNAGGDTTEAFIKRYMAWGILFFVLIAAADVPTISPLAIAFAWLIFLSIFFSSGLNVFQRITTMENQGSPDPPPTHGRKH